MKALEPHVTEGPRGGPRSNTITVNTAVLSWESELQSEGEKGTAVKKLLEAPDKKVSLIPSDKAALSQAQMWLDSTWLPFKKQGRRG